MKKEFKDILKWCDEMDQWIETERGWVLEEDLNKLIELVASIRKAVENIGELPEK